LVKEISFYFRFRWWPGPLSANISISSAFGFNKADAFFDHLASSTNYCSGTNLYLIFFILNSKISNIIFNSVANLNFKISFETKFHQIPKISKYQHILMHIGFRISPYCMASFYIFVYNLKTVANVTDHATLRLH